MSNSVMDVFITLLLGGILLPVGISQIFNANTTGWDPTSATIWPLIVVVGLVSIIIGLIQGFKKGAFSR